MKYDSIRNRQRIEYEYGRKKGQDKRQEVYGTEVTPFCRIPKAGLAVAGGLTCCVGNSLRPIESNQSTAGLQPQQDYLEYTDLQPLKSLQRPSTLIDQIDNRNIRNPRIGSETYLTGTAIRIPHGTPINLPPQLPQCISIQFRKSHTLVTSKPATPDPLRHNHIRRKRPQKKTLY